MSFFDDASLAFLPSGGAGKDGKAYSIKPTDGTGDFTFSRGSNLTATRVGPTGLIEKGRENLFTYSNDFSNTAWSKNNTSVTSGQSGYDGSSDAWLLEKSAVSLAYINQNVSASGAYTISVYAKAGTLDTMNFFISASKRVQFNLGNGTIDSSSSGVVDSKIEAVSGATGWYRCSATFADATTYVRIYPQWTETTAGSIFIQDAQLEVGLAATDYIESGASTGKAGLLENEPRFDYSGGATCPSLLLEPQRVQLVEYSEYIDGFDKAGTPTLSLESETNPSGSGFAYKVTATETGSRVQQTIGTQGNNFVFSGFFKGTGTATRIRFRNNQGEAVFYDIDASGNFTLYTEDAANDNYDIEDYGNGWYRIYFETTTASGGTDNYIQVYPDVLDGDGSVLIWGLQAEEGSYPTSYIPNHSGGIATRTGDSLYKQNINSILGSEGTLYLEIEPYDVSTSTSVFKKILGLFKTNGSVADAIYLEEYNGNWGVWVRKGNSTITSTGYKTTQPTKVAVTFGTGGSKIYFDGVQEAITSTDTSNAMNQISTRENAGNGIESVLKVKQLVYFPEALSDADCITLTTL